MFPGFPVVVAQNAATAEAIAWVLHFPLSWRPSSWVHFPKFNPEPGCRAASAINQSMELAVSQDYKACMADEDSAKEELQKSWSKYSADDKRRCGS
jgi:hypothetical protein